VVLHTREYWTVWGLVSYTPSQDTAISPGIGISQSFTYVALALIPQPRTTFLWQQYQQQHSSINYLCLPLYWK